MSQLVIVGLGLIGGSIALGVRRNRLVDSIVGIDLAAVENEVLDRKLVDEFIPVEDKRAADATLLASSISVLSAPVGVIEGWLSPALAGHAVVTDCGSTKRTICARASTLNNAERFVPGHPMAGDPAGGLSAATADLFRGRRWILCPDGATQGSVQEVERLVTGLGAIVVYMDPARHDRAVAMTSHLPQLLASQLLVMSHEADALDAAGPGFAAATRVAGGRPEMWRDIFATNADEVGAALAALCDDLSVLSRGLQEVPAKVEPALKLLSEARRLRKS